MFEGKILSIVINSIKRLVQINKKVTTKDTTTKVMELKLGEATFKITAPLDITYIKSSLVDDITGKASVHIITYRNVAHNTDLAELWEIEDKIVNVEIIQGNETMQIKQTLGQGNAGLIMMENEDGTIDLKSIHPTSLHTAEELEG